MLFLPLFLFLLSPQARLRFNEVNIFSDISVIQRTNQEIANDKNSLISRVLHNRRVAYGVEYIRHYFDNLSPSFLFVKGDGNPKFSIQDVGELYLWEIPFFIGGVFLLFKKREGRWYLLPLWFFVGILPAASARETPHALRIETILPTVQIFTAYGLYHMFSYFHSKKFRQVSLIALSVFGLFNFIYFYHNYTANYPREYSGEWQYGYKDTVALLNGVDKNYDKIYFTESLGRPYIYVLFYKKYSPQQFRSEAKIDREALGFVHVRSFGKYVFVRDISYNKLGKTLYIDTPDKVPHGSHIIKTVNLLNGNPALVAYE